MTDHPADTPRRCDGAGAPIGCHGAVHPVRGANLCDNHERFYAGLADTPRLTDADVRKIEQSLKLCQAYHTACRHKVSPEDHARTLLAALREARAILSALKAHSCPINLHDAGEGASVDYCAFCGAMIDGHGYAKDEPHRPMEDGEPCLWERIERA